MRAVIKRYIPLTLFMAVAVFVTGAFFVFSAQLSFAPESPEKVSIALAATTHTVLAQVAEARGYYREQGLDVTIRPHSFGKLALEDMLEGRADFATVAETPVVLAVMKGEIISIIATIQTSREANAIVTRKDRPISTLKDLKGRKVAVTPGTTSDYFLDAVLGYQGISRKEVKTVDMRAEEIPNALARGEVDAASLFDPYVIIAQKKLGDSGTTFNEKNVYTWTFNVVAKQDFIRKYPGKVRKMLRALIQAEEFVKNNPAEAQKIVADFTGQDIDIAVVRDAWAGVDFKVNLDQSLLLALEDESKWAIKNGLTGGNQIIPNYLNFIYLEGLESVKPDAINILR